MKNISRVLVLPVALLAANASANCPLFEGNVCAKVYNNKNLIAATLVADNSFGKNEHAKKAFMSTASTFSSNGKADQLAERFVVDYAIRKGSDALGLNGYRDAILKKCDVLPEGMIRDNVQPVVEGAAAVVTHPEFLTMLAMEYVIPQVVAMVNKP
jgi:hypothetical protein